MKYLVIGSGGREHCIAWRLLSDGSASRVFTLPGNGGIPSDSRVNIAIDDFDRIASFCASVGIDMVVVGPEVPLAAGIVDFLTEKNIPVFGPTQKAAMLESSKLYAKYIMKKYSIPTAESREFNGKAEIMEFIEKENIYPLVIKLDALAAGKGVAIPTNRFEALDFINSNVKENTRVFTETYLEGEEASVLGISDGVRIKCLIAAQDHKRVFEGDIGPNTGGMGAYAPAPVVTPALMERIQKEIMQPVIDGMNAESVPFKGVLYAGLMINKDKLNVLEFNARLGDPETQVILPLLNERLGDIIGAAVSGNIDKQEISFSDMHAITVVMASAGYPGAYEKGKPVSGLNAGVENVTVFHAGTEEKNGQIVTSGGRVLNVSATGRTLADARDTAYSALRGISFEGAFYRSDIAHRALGGKTKP
ncbi:MAG: phosphoribosylamine--glycine ligase [Leptospirales bacterium]|nr:phosphoribosylamine--glycine ligase [Leptospirales bacterium]